MSEARSEALNRSDSGLSRCFRSNRTYLNSIDTGEITSNRHLLAGRHERQHVADPVAKTNPDGVDFGWVMQVTFVVTIVVGSPLVALLSTTVDLPTWGARATFAIRAGAPIWLTTNVAAYLYAKYKRDETGEDGTATDAAAADDTDE